MRIPWSVLIIIAQSFVGGASADELSAEAVARREGIVPASKEGLVVAGGYCFSAAMAQGANDSESAMNAAEKHAGARALAQYLAATLMIDDPPPGLPETLLEHVRSRCATVIIAHLMLGGVETLQENRDIKSRTATVVKAIAVEQLEKEKRHWAGCLDLIRDSAREGHLDDALLWADVLAATGNDFTPALELWMKRLCERPGLAATLCGLPMRVPDGWTKLPEKIEPAKLSGLSDDRLLDLLDRRPFDGSLIDLYRDRLEAKGHIVASKSTSDWYRLAPAKLVPATLLTATFQAAGIEDPLAHSEIAIVLKYGDSWPIFRDVSATDEAVRLFKKGETETSLSLLLREFAAKPNASCANYIAACLLVSENFESAEAWAMLALKWEPSHPYAAVNLMRAMALRGSVKEARMIAESLADAKYLDAWGASEVERILQMPEEKPKSETLDRSAPPE